MLVCRSAWQRLAPLTQRSTAALLRNAPVRQMSAGSVPGSTGENLPYYLFVGLSFVVGGAYAYRTVSNDRTRFRERHEYIETKIAPLTIGEDESVTVEAREVSQTTEEAVEATIEEAVEEEVTAQEDVPTTSVEQEQTVAEEEVSPSSAEVEPTASTEASTEKAEQEQTEVVVEVVAAEISPVLEESSDNILEELASAAEDWTELSARKPEESAEENAPAAQESEEVVESEEVAASS